MGTNTLIQTVQDATTELGLPLPTAAILAQDNTGRQMGQLANRCGRLLMRMHDWKDLTQQWTIVIPPTVVTSATMTAANAQIQIPQAIVPSLTASQMVVTGPGLATSTRLIGLASVGSLPVAIVDQPPTMTGTFQITFRTDTMPQPPDYERGINRTQWDRSMRWELRGPQSPQSDQWVRSGIVATGPRRMYRPINDSFRFWPSPATSDAGSIMVSEYVSSYWVRDAGGNAKPRFTADNDTCVFDDDVMVTGLKYLFFATKGFDTTSLLEQWQQVTKVAIAADGTKPTLDMDRNRFPIFISPSNVQDADFPGSFGNR